MTKHEARAVAEAIMWKHALQPEHGRRFIPDPEAMKSAITSALLSATREQAELLQVAPNSLLLRVQSVSYAQNRTIVDFSEIYQNTSKYNVKHITRR